MRRLVAIVQRLDIAGKGSESDATMPSWMHELYLKISDSGDDANRYIVFVRYDHVLSLLIPAL